MLAKRSIQGENGEQAEFIVINEHFEATFNAKIATQVALQRFVPVFLARLPDFRYVYLLKNQYN